jgi:hypothetical protein
VDNDVEPSDRDLSGALQEGGGHGAAPVRR